MSTVQRPLELILARNLMGSLATPTLLIDQQGLLIFCNRAAGELLGRPCEELARMGSDLWEQIGPFDRAGQRVRVGELPLTAALRQGSPEHAALTLRSLSGQEHDIELSAIPIRTAQGAPGAIAFFWPQPATGPAA